MQIGRTEDRFSLSDPGKLFGVVESLDFETTVMGIGYRVSGLLMAAN